MFRGVELANTLLRVSIFTTASAAALGLFAMTQAAPARTSAPAAYVVAAMNPPAGDDVLADDAAAAGLTGRSDRGAYVPPPPPAPSRAPAQAQAPADDPIGDLAASPPAPRAEAEAKPYDEPQDEPDTPRPRAARTRHHPHPMRATARPSREVEASAAPAPTIPEVHAAPRRAIHPHRLHIVIEPPARALLAPEQGAAPVSADLPHVQADQPPPIDVDSQLRQLARAASAEMGLARFELSPGLSSGREGQAVVTLPAALLSRLEADAEASGVAAGDLAITVTLSGQGYDIVPDHALTSTLDTGRPATFAWRITPSSARAGALTASMSAALSLGGEARTLPLGLLTAEIPPAAAIAAPAAPTAAPAPVEAPVPSPDLSTRLRADLGKVRLPDPSRLRLHDLAIPGRPTLDVPGLGEVASERVVAGGLLVVLFLLIKALLRGSADRAQRRRSLASLDDPYFRGEHS